MPINNWLSDNSNVLLGLSAGLLGGRTASDQLGQGFQNAADAATGNKRRNKTMEFLQRMNPELAAAVEAGTLSPLDAYKTHVEAQKPQKPNYMSVGKNVFNEDTGEWIAAPAGMGGEEPPEYGLTPQTTVDAAGNPVLVQLSKSGQSRQVELPNGLKLSKEPIRLDAGTHFVLLDPITRQPVGQIPKQLAEAASETAQGTAAGKAIGETRSEYDSITSKMPGLQGVVDRLDKLSEDATYTTTGKGVDLVRKELGMAPRDAAVARAEYTAVVDNQILPLLRDTFGAQFTAEEGQRLARTLGDPDKSPTEKQALLRAFIQQKERDIQALSTRLGGVQARQPTSGNSGKTKSGLTFTVEP